MKMTGRDQLPSETSEMPVSTTMATDPEVDSSGDGVGVTDQTSEVSTQPPDTPDPDQPQPGHNVSR